MKNWVINEIDPDNDGDGLEDGIEIAGTAFVPRTGTDPNRADSDGDGASDAAEAAAGSNPGNKTEYLHFTRAAESGDGSSLAWQARSGKSYRIYAKTAWDGIPDGNLVATVPITGGSPPWFVTTGHVFDAEATNVDHRVYYVEVGP